jgi:hypothetical protein
MYNETVGQAIAFRDSRWHIVQRYEPGVVSWHWVDREFNELFVQLLRSELRAKSKTSSIFEVTVL